MKTLQIIAFITTGLVPVLSTLAQDSVAVEGKVVLTTNREPVGAFTVKAYPAQEAASKKALALNAIKPLAQTLTRADGTFSLPISLKLKTVVLRFEKLSYFSVPPQQTVQLTAPKTTVPDVAAVRHNDAQTVSVHDLLDAFSIRKASFDTMNAQMPAAEREKALKKLAELDLISLQKSGVDPVTIMAVKKEP